MATLAKVETENSSADRKRIYEPFGEYHMCWYPVAVAAELRPGELKSMHFCDTRIVVFRGEDGVARAVSARCRHMGADIGLGKVVGNNVQCPFHHWEYNGSGHCVRIPSGDKIPNGTSLLEFPCQEVQGLIWVFWGTEPTYPVPVVPNCEDGRVLSRSFELVPEKRLMVEPWVFASNTFDFAHFRSVHEFEMKNTKVVFDDAQMYWESEIEVKDEAKKFKGLMRLEAFGVGAVISYMEKEGQPAKRHVAALSPKGEDGLGLFFTIFAELKDDSAEAHADAIERLDELERLHRTLPLEDLDVLNSIEYGKIRLTEVDRELAAYLRYASTYPRTTMKKLEAEMASRRVR